MDGNTINNTAADTTVNTAVVENTFGGFGTLQVNTSFRDLGTPVEGANVQIINPNTGEVIEEMQTNAEGNIPDVELPTPPLEFSLESGLPRPFNQYNVSVTVAGYEDVLIRNVQIFPTTRAIQNVSLTPQLSNIVIPYPVLWGDYPFKIPEAEIKELPFAGNYVVLPEPVVPNIISVHAGRPNDTSAPNYFVTFKDYVKNVASSEIYSTWPVETIKANVLAIISFTLNRVYTEWYRGKGYDFTITNSTAFDQSFNYGRNIFQEISDVVDEVFTTYISKSDIIQPLFTQYCDGREVRREGWLSQWGSKDLGDQGYSAFNILRNYYGYDIVLKEARRVEGVPISFTRVLRVGSAGESVSVIQEQLNAISNNYPLIPKLVVDGSYGERTAEAVRTFQQIFNLPQTGEVNFPTWYRISDIYVAISRLA